MKQHLNMLLTGTGWTICSAALAYFTDPSLLPRLLLFTFFGWFGIYMMFLGVRSILRKDTYDD